MFSFFSNYTIIMTSSTIIECRQADSQNVRTNGDWENVLIEPITIYPDDEIGIKSVFIDTLAQTNNKINIEKDTTISIGMSYYQLDWKTDDKTYTNAGVNPDGKMYILSKKHDGKTIPGAVRVTKLTFVQASYNPESNWGNVTAQFSYVNINNQKATTSVKIPDEAGSTPFIDIGVSIICLLDTSTGNPRVTCTNPDTIKKNNASWSGVIGPGSQEPADYDLYDPHIGTVSMTIPKGSYEPNQITKLLNDEFSQNGADSYVDGDSPVASELLLNTKDYNGSNSYYMNWADNTGNNNIATYNNTKFHYIGTNQFSVDFDEAQQRFYFQYLHMPYYNNDNIAVQWVKSDNPANKYFLANKNSGILLNSLEPTSFWQDQLGFNLENILTQFTFDAVAAEKYPVPINALSDGINMTGGFRGLP